MKKRIIIGVLVALIALTVAVAADAATGSKQIAATYRNIMIMVDGTTVTPEPGMGEPFIVDSEGRTYVPIRLAAEALGMQVEWVDWLNAVKITGSTSSDELAALKAENEALRDKIKKLEEGSGSITDLEKTLVRDYDELGDVAIEDISLSGDEDDVDVDIEVDLDKYADEWDGLTDSEIKNWIKDLVGDIQDELSDDTYVSGTIIDIDSDDTLVKFSKSGTSSLKVTFYDEDYRGGGGDADNAIDELEGSSYDVGGIDFTLETVTYKESNDSVTAKLYAVYSGAVDDWDELSSSKRKSGVTDICEEIVDAFDQEGIDLETVTITFYDKNSTTIASYKYTVSSEKLAEL